jgi:hypothetical protein
MKKTAVEWLVEQIKNNVHNTIDEFELLVNKAKELEKNQIIDSFNQGSIYAGNFFDRVNITAENYYNKTFKSE